MNATADQIYANNSSTKRLWIAVGALGTAMLVMGGALVYQSARAPESRIAPPAASVSLPPNTVSAVGTTPAAPAAPAALTQDEAEKPVVAPVKKAPVSARPPAVKNDRVVASGNSPAANVPAVGAPAVVAQTAPQPTPQPVRSVCSNCGTVESATPIQREGSGTGLGAVAGGVLGAVVGNQVGGGNGRTAATVLGALGGGWAGNSVEKKMKKETLYQVRVRMEDGGSRTFEVAAPVSAGSRVTVEGGSLRRPDGSLASPLPVQPQRQTQQSGPSPTQTGG